MPSPTIFPGDMSSRKLLEGLATKIGGVNGLENKVSRGQFSELEAAVAAQNSTGFAEWTSGTSGSTYTITGGKFQLDRAGYGYIKSTRVDWVAGQQTSALTAWATSWIYIGSNGLIGTTTNGGTAFDGNRIVLFETYYDSTAGEYITVCENHSYDFPSKVSSYLHANLNVVIRGTGANLTRVGTGFGALAADREVWISGSDYMDDHGLATQIPDTNWTAVGTHFMYLDVNSHWRVHSIGTEFPAYYNNGGVPTALNDTDSLYTAWVVYVSKNDIESTTPKYFAAMPFFADATYRGVYDYVATAQLQFATGALKSLELCQLGIVIIKYSADGGYVYDIVTTKSTLRQPGVDGVLPPYYLRSEANINFIKGVVSTTEPPNPFEGMVWIEPLV